MFTIRIKLDETFTKVTVYDLTCSCGFYTKALENDVIRTSASHIQKAHPDASSWNSLLETNDRL